jgi:hypothetical protein
MNVQAYSALNSHSNKSTQELIVYNFRINNCPLFRCPTPTVDQDLVTLKSSIVSPFKKIRMKLSFDFLFTK